MTLPPTPITAQTTQASTTVTTARSTPVTGARQQRPHRPGRWCIPPSSRSACRAPSRRRRRLSPVTASRGRPMRRPTTPTCGPSWASRAVAAPGGPSDLRPRCGSWTRSSRSAMMRAFNHAVTRATASSAHASFRRYSYSAEIAVCLPVAQTHAGP